jgi:hypothetical protein
LPTFQLCGLPHEPFESLFDLSDERLRALRMVRQISTDDVGFPCRVSLQDAAAGEELLLLSHVHQPASSPYSASGPIFVRRRARQARLAPGVVPPYVSRRLISLRAYDLHDMMLDATVCEGTAVGKQLERTFSNPGVAYVHLHNAKRGCYSCLASRVMPSA